VSWTAWDLAPFVLAGAAVALARFADAFVRLRRRGRADHAPWSRAGLFLLAVAVGTLPLISPLDEAGDTYLLSAHMLQHVLIADVAPALALVALRGPLLFFFLPSPVMRRVAHSHRVRGALAFLLRPRISLTIWVLVFGGWHIPALYDYTLTHQTTHDLEHLSFIAAGLLAWMQIVDPARRNALTASQRLGCAFAMVCFSVGLGGVLLATAPLYPAYASQATRLFGLSAAADQHLAAIVMIAEQLGAFVLCTAFLLPDRAQARVARTRLLAADRPADALP
jgi:cytochrome c oxidase assembly factor CtaG